MEFAHNPCVYVARFYVQGSPQPHFYAGSTVNATERKKEEEERGPKCPAVLRSAHNLKYLRWYPLTGIRLAGGGFGPPDGSEAMKRQMLIREAVLAVEFARAYGVDNVRGAWFPGGIPPGNTRALLQNALDRIEYKDKSVTLEDNTRLPLPLWLGLVHVSTQLWAEVEAAVEEVARDCPEIAAFLSEQPYHAAERKRKDRDREPRAKRDPAASKRKRWNENPENPENP